MKKIKTYNQFKESLLIDLDSQVFRDLLESLNIEHDILLSSIGAEKMNIFDELKLDKDFKLDLDIINDDKSDTGGAFINSLTSLGLKKSPLENSDNYQTFLNTSCRFLFIYKGDSDMLENPVYILIQSSDNDDDETNRWLPTEFYKLDQSVSINKFYDKLTSRTVEINDGDDNYIYITNNVNEWILQNTEKENDVYKKVFRKSELENILSNRNITINIL